jgi:hypothetical protein
MKRAIILVSALALCLGLAPAASAAPDTNPVVQQAVYYPFAGEFLPSTVEFTWTSDMTSAYTMYVTPEFSDEVLYSKAVSNPDLSFWNAAAEGDVFHAGDAQRALRICVQADGDPTAFTLGNCDKVVLNGYNGTRPQLSPNEVFPYVVGGRPDQMNVAFTPNQAISDQFGGYSLQVYPEGTIWWNWGEGILWKAPVPAGNAAPPWNPRLQGDVLKGIGSRNVMVCIYPTGTHLEDTDTFVRWCSEGKVTHFQADHTVTKRKWGRAFRGGAGGCELRRLLKPVSINCGKGETAKLRYLIARPALGDEERSIGVNMNWKGRVFRLGDGITLNRTGKGALVTASAKFWGKVRWVSKTWTVRTEW